MSAPWNPDLSKWEEAGAGVSDGQGLALAPSYTSPGGATLRPRNCPALLHPHHRAAGHTGSRTIGPSGAEVGGCSLKTLLPVPREARARQGAGDQALWPVPILKGLRPREVLSSHTDGMVSGTPCPQLLPCRGFLVCGVNQVRGQGRAGLISRAGGNASSGTDPKCKGGVAHVPLGMSRHTGSHAGRAILHESGSVGTLRQGRTSKTRRSERSHTRRPHSTGVQDGQPWEDWWPGAGRRKGEVGRGVKSPLSSCHLSGTGWRSAEEPAWHPQALGLTRSTTIVTTELVVATHACAL